MKKLITAAAVAMMAMTGAASADGHGDYPERPIMLMVSYGAGGATDFQARIVTMTAGNEDALGMPVAIINALRTPIGRYGGALSSVRPDDLAALVIRAVVERSGIDPTIISPLALETVSLEEREEDFREILREGFALRYISLLVLGKHRTGGHPDAR